VAAVGVAVIGHCDRTGKRLAALAHLGIRGPAFIRRLNTGALRYEYDARQSQIDVH
jgi:hypothetical protein